MILYMVSTLVYYIIAHTQSVIIPVIYRVNMHISYLSYLIIPHTFTVIFDYVIGYYLKLTKPLVSHYLNTAINYPILKQQTFT